MGRTLGRGLRGLVCVAWCVAPLAALAAPPVALEPVATASLPLYVTHAGDGRLFIAQRTGEILIHEESQGLLPTPFLDLSGVVRYTLADADGLIALAFHPDYASNGRFFVSYLDDGGVGGSLRSVIARYEVSAGDPNVADPGSQRILLTLDQPHGFHNNDDLRFGPQDGMLYVSFGDGGPAMGTDCRSQQGSGFFGKLLRLDVDQNTSTPPYHGVPVDNPFVGVAGIADEIWALGFRNPWRFSFDPVTGDLWIGDVGENAREEVDRQPAASGGGENYGWKVMEGTSCYDPDPIDPACPVTTPSCFDAAYTDPVFEYDTGSDCAVIGGFVYRGSKIPDLWGAYVFGDSCSARVWTLRQDTMGTWVRDEILDAGSGLNSFGEDVDGELYLTVGDEVLRLVGPPPVPALGPAGLAALLALLGGAAWAAARRR